MAQAIDIKDIVALMEQIADRLENWAAEADSMDVTDEVQGQLLELPWRKLGQILLGSRSLCHSIRFFLVSILPGIYQISLPASHTSAYSILRIRTSMSLSSAKSLTSSEVSVLPK